MLPPHLKGYIQIATAAVLSGLIGIFVKLTSQMPIGSIIFYRLLFGLIAIALFFTCCRRLSELRLGQKKQYILLLGLMQTGTMLSYFFSVKHTSVSIAVLLLYTAPVYVTLLSPFLLKEYINRRSIFALAIAIIGVILVIRPDTLFQDLDYTHLIGLVSGLFSGLFYGGMILTSRYLKDYYTGTTQAAWALFITLLIFSPYSVAITAKILLDNLGILVLFGFISTALALVLYLSGLMQVRAQHASIVALLEPASAVVFAYLILSEPVTASMLAGGALILLGAVIISRERPVEIAHE